LVRSAKAEIPAMAFRVVQTVPVMAAAVKAAVEINNPAEKAPTAL
jgi:hypothetical protein